MAITYIVYKYCYTCSEYCYTEMVDTLDNDWIPPGHEGHDLDDLVVEEKKET